MIYSLPYTSRTCCCFFPSSFLSCHGWLPSPAPPAFSLTESQKKINPVFFRGKSRLLAAHIFFVIVFILSFSICVCLPIPPNWCALAIGVTCSKDSFTIDFIWSSLVRHDKFFARDICAPTQHDVGTQQLLVVLSSFLVYLSIIVRCGRYRRLVICRWFLHSLMLLIG